MISNMLLYVTIFNMLIFAPFTFHLEFFLFVIADCSIAMGMASKLSVVLFCSVPDFANNSDFSED